MIPKETEAEILRLFHAEKWRIGTIAEQFGLHHTCGRSGLFRRRSPGIALRRLDVEIGKTPYARFDLNDYSIPHDRTQRSLTILADLETVRIVEKSELLATHVRSWGRGQQVQHTEHLARLVAEKSALVSTAGLIGSAKQRPEANRSFAVSPTAIKTSAATRRGFSNCWKRPVERYSMTRSWRFWSATRSTSVLCARSSTGCPMDADHVVVV